MEPTATADGRAINDDLRLLGRGFKTKKGADNRLAGDVEWLAGGDCVGEVALCNDGLYWVLVSNKDEDDDLDTCRSCGHDPAIPGQTTCATCTPGSIR